MRPFTLIELLLVIFLIGIGVSLLSLNIPRVLKRQKFERGVDLIVHKIELAQETLLDYRADVHLAFWQEGGKLWVKITVDQPLCERLKNALNRHCEIRGVETVTFNDRELPFELFFDGSLGLTPYGSLHCVGGSKQRITIPLKGYPCSVTVP